VNIIVQSTDFFPPPSSYFKDLSRACGRQRCHHSESHLGKCWTHCLPLQVHSPPALTPGQWPSGTVPKGSLASWFPMGLTSRSLQWEKGERQRIRRTPARPGRKLAEHVLPPKLLSGALGTALGHCTTPSIPQVLIPTALLTWPGPWPWMKRIFWVFYPTLNEGSDWLWLPPSTPPLLPGPQCHTDGSLIAATRPLTRSALPGLYLECPLAPSEVTHSLHYK
jgi:hypothetical protein